MSYSQMIRFMKRPCDIKPTMDKAEWGFLACNKRIGSSGYLSLGVYKGIPG